MNHPTALQRAADAVGGQAALAEKIGLPDRRTVWAWSQEGRRVPAEYCPLIERATEGKVRCEELRPDVAWGILREQTA